MRFVRNLLATGMAAAALTAVSQAQPIVDAEGDVGIGTLAPDPSSILELQSTTKGFLTPRMTTVQRNVIASPADGLLIYNTDTKIFEYWASIPGAWLPVGAVSGPYWLLTGNSALTEYSGGGPGVDNYIGTNDATDFSLVTQFANNIDFWTNNTHVAILDANGNLGVGELAPSARVDVVGDNVNTAIEATNGGGITAVEATVDGGSGLILGSAPAIYGDNDDETGVAGTSGLGIGVFGASGSNHGVNGLALLGGVAGVFGRNDIAGGFGVQGVSFGGATGVHGSSTTGIAGAFEITNAASAANSLQIDNAGSGDGAEINVAAGSVGIDLNGGELDGDDQGNALGDGSANQQLTVRGSADAVIGNTLAGNPTVWDLVVTGDAVASGIIKAGSSIWIDGFTGGNHQIVANDQLNVGTLGPDDLNISTNSIVAINVDGPTQNVSISNNLNVAGNTQVTGDLNVDGATTLDETTVDGTFDQVGGAQVTLSGNVNANGGVDVDGGDLTVASPHQLHANGDANTIGDGTGGTQLTVDGDGAANVGNGYEFVVEGDAQVQGTLGLTSLTDGSVLFIENGGQVTEDNANFFWDDGSNELGIGTSAPSAKVDIVQIGGFAPALEVTATGIIGNALEVSSPGSIGNTINVTAPAIGIGLNVVSSGIGEGIVVTASGGDGIVVNETAGNEGITINESGAGDGLEINASGTGLGIDLNGGALDGDAAANFLGSATANQQLTVRGVANAVIGNTLAGNAAAWDLVVTGDMVATGLVKVGGSMWLDGTSATHQLNTNAPLLVATTAGNIEIDAAGGLTTIDDNLVVTGTSNLQGDVFNSTGSVTINDNVVVTGTTNLQGDIFNSTGDLDVSDHIIPTADATYDLGSNVNRWRDVYIDGASLHVGSAIGAELEVTYAGGDANFNVNGAAGPQINIDAPGGIIRFDPNGNGILNQFFRADGIGVNTGLGTDILIAQDGIRRNGGATETFAFSNTGGVLDVSTTGDFSAGQDISAGGDAAVGGMLSVSGAGNTIGNNTNATQLTIDGVAGVGAYELVVDGDVQITGELNFAGGFTLGADLDMNGNAIVDNFDGIVTVNDDFEVSGNATLNSLDVTNQTTSGTLEVGGTSLFIGNAEFDGTVQFDGATTFNATSTWSGGSNITLNNGTITANKTAAGSAVAINNTNGTTAIALNVAAGGGRTILSYGTGAGVIPTDVSVWNATGNVTLPGSTENGQILYVVNSSGGAITVTGVTGGTAAGFNNNDVRGYVYTGGWYELP